MVNIAPSMCDVMASTPLLCSGCSACWDQRCLVSPPPLSLTQIEMRKPARAGRWRLCRNCWYRGVFQSSDSTRLSCAGILAYLVVLLVTSVLCWDFGVPGRVVWSQQILFLRVWRMAVMGVLRQSQSPPHKTSNRGLTTKQVHPHLKQQSKHR